MDFAAVLQRKLHSMFPDALARREISKILGSYGSLAHEKEPLRVRLAILKLSEADVQSIKQTTRMAKQDYRDVLAWAEYPRQVKTRLKPGDANRQKLTKADREEYERWLEK
jgi:hypothetical protein